MIGQQTKRNNKIEHEQQQFGELSVKEMNEYQANFFE